jgi:hypothetical protein
MTDNLLTLLKDPQYIKCWYPSSGDDFEVTKKWSDGHGNSIIPNLFILTDLDLDGYQERINTKERLINQGYEFVSELLFDSTLITPSIIDWSFNKIEWSNIPNQKFIDVISDGAFDEYIGKIDKDDFFELIDMGINSINDCKSNFAEMPDNLKVKLLAIINDDYDEINFAHLYKKENNLIIFIQCPNIDFYEYCRRECITIEATIIIRHEFDRFLRDELLNVFEVLNTNSVFVYRNQCSVAEIDFFTQHQISFPIKYLSYHKLFNNGSTDELIFSEWLVNN